MEKIRIKSYAIKHKLSIFNVMKMVKSGKLKSQIVVEEGKDITYILIDDIIEKEIQKGIIPLEEKENMNVKEELIALKKEVQILKNEIEILKKSLD